MVVQQKCNLVFTFMHASSLRSHARAKVQSRITVPGEKIKT
jgi:hypothetical protein